MAIKPTHSARVDAVARRIISNKSRYKSIEQATGVPWQVVGLMHYRESNLDFACNLHNGQSLGKRTTIVPKGRGPFESFEESAYDALVTLKKLDQITDWSIERICYEMERYNGFGYQGRKGGNPYLWGGTNNYTKGKYVADHVYDANHVDAQLGVMPILKRVYDLDITKKELVKNSTTLSVFKWARIQLQAFAAFVASLVTADALDIWRGWVDWLKEYIPDMKTLVYMAATMALTTLLLKWAENRRMKEYEQDNYTPSKMAGTEGGSNE